MCCAGSLCGPVAAADHRRLWPGAGEEAKCGERRARAIHQDWLRRLPSRDDGRSHRPVKRLAAARHGTGAPSGTLRRLCSSRVPVREKGKQAVLDRTRVVDFSVPREDATLWRTPPLWGVASSAPYLHDGRAETLLDAIELHGGQGLRSAQLFSGLSATEKDSVLTFLSMYIAPPTAEQIPKFQGGGWGMAMGGSQRGGF